MIRRRIFLGSPVVVALLSFSLSYSGSGNTRTEPFEIEGTTATVRWQVTPREEGPMCRFNLHLVGIDESGGTTSVDQVVVADFFPRRAARTFGLPERPSGEAQVDVAPGTYVVSIFAEHYRFADGRTLGCEDYSVNVDG